jgi:hypothetical protein
MRVPGPVRCGLGLFASWRLLTRAQRLLATLALTACADGGQGIGPSPDQPPPPPAVAVGGLRGVVDVTRGTLTFEPVRAAGATRTGPRDIGLASIYGDQGITVRLYNSPVVVAPSSTPGKETHTANVGMRNLLAFPIGDEQAGVPLDTMGVYVFVNSGPRVTATSSPCSPACTVTVRNAHGALTFSEPGQAYWHWNERLDAFGAGSDTTRARLTWVFEADTQVTAFTFDVLVSAAWPPPHETRWKMAYEGDSVPDVAVEPRWTRNAAGTPTMTHNSPGPGILTIAVPAGGRVAFYQSDSLNTTTNAYVETRFRTNTPTMTAPELSFGIDDQVKFIAVGVSATQAGFINSSFSFLAGSVPVTAGPFHTYQLRKFSADSVQLWIDGIHRASQAYSTLSAHLPVTPHGFYFGPAGTGANPVSPAGNSSSWDYMIYEIGATEP